MTILLMLETAGISYSKVVVDDDASEPGGCDFLHGWETLGPSVGPLMNQIKQRTLSGHTSVVTSERYRQERVKRSTSN